MKRSAKAIVLEIDVKDDFLENCDIPPKYIVKVRYDDGTIKNEGSEIPCQIGDIVKVDFSEFFEEPNTLIVDKYLNQTF